jgi:ankyrin repeat protein
MPLTQAQKDNLTEYFKNNSLIPEKILQSTAEEKKAFAKRYLSVIKGAYDEDLRTFCYLWHLPDNSRFDQIYNINLSDLRDFTISYIETELEAPKLYGLFNLKKLPIDNEYMSMAPILKQIYEIIYKNKLEELKPTHAQHNTISILILAARLGREEFLEFFLNKKVILKQLTGIDFLTIADASGLSLLQIAVWREHTKCINCLLKHGANPNKHGEATEPPLNIATRTGNVLSVCALIKYKAEITIDIIDYAMCTNRLDIALILIKKIPQELINGVSLRGIAMLSRCLALFNPLFVEEQQMKLKDQITIPNSANPMSLLTHILKRGANTNIETRDPKPLDLSITGKADDAVTKLLVEHDAHFNQQHIVTLIKGRKNPETTRLMIEKASVDLLDSPTHKNGELILNTAILFKDIDVTKQLISKGANFELKDKDGMCPSLITILQRGTDMAQIINNAIESKQKKRANESPGLKL